MGVKVALASLGLLVITVIFAWATLPSSRLYALVCDVENVMSPPLPIAPVHDLCGCAELCGTVLLAPVTVQLVVNRLPSKVTDANASFTVAPTNGHEFFIVPGAIGVASAMPSSGTYGSFSVLHTRR